MAQHSSLQHAIKCPVRQPIAQLYLLSSSQRDQAIRQARADGMSQKDIVEATGYTRETIRRILDPAAAEAVRQAAAERRRQRKQAS